MPERTAAEVLAEKLKHAWRRAGGGSFLQADALAEALAEDPAITVRTDMVVERVVVEFHYRWTQADAGRPHDPHQVHHFLTSDSHYYESPDHRIIVRPYPESG